MTNPIDKAQLRALAEAATPGPWTRKEYATVHAGKKRVCGHVNGASEKPLNISQQIALGDANAAFIAAANPATIIALLDEVEALRADAARLEKDRSQVLGLIFRNVGERVASPLESGIDGLGDTWHRFEVSNGQERRGVIITVTELARAAASIGNKGDADG